MRRFPVRKHKFDTQRQELDGYKFQSKAEFERYKELKLLKANGSISDVEVHPRFKIEINRVKICTVVLDFAYRLIRTGSSCVECQGERCKNCIGDGAYCACDHGPTMRYEDVKVEKRGRDGKIVFSTDTRISKIGRKLLKATYGIDVNLIYHT